MDDRSTRRLAATGPPGFDPMALRAFYGALGHRTAVAGGAVWFDGGRFSIMSIPTATVPDIGAAQVRGILLRTGKVAAVYRASEPGETTVPLFVLRDKNYDYRNLQRQFRQQVRAAQSSMSARECTWEEWRVGALPCDRDTLSRHHGVVSATHPLLTDEGRARIAAAAASVPGLRVHACFGVKGIEAYLVHLTIGETCEGLLAQRRSAPRDARERFASHLLYFAFARAAVARPEISAVCVGRESVPANAPLAQFKRHAGFAPEACHVRVRLHPVFAPLLENRAASAFLRMIRNSFAGKLSGLTNLEVLERSALRARR